MHPLLKILAFVALLGAGAILASICIAILAFAQGIDMAAFANAMLSGEGDFPDSLLKGMLWIQAIVGFILPGLAFALIFYRNTWVKYFGLSKAPSLLTVIFAVAALFAAYPLVQLSFEINSLIPLPNWMTAMEENATDVLAEVLNMQSASSYIMTLILVGVLPGIGEELVFRGIIQRQIQEWSGRPVLSVWIAAIIFSTIHMQFEGFLPRVALGAVLGFVYLWSRNLWVPMLVHAVNNGMQVSVLYFTGIDLSDVEQEPSMPLNAWIIILSVAVLYLCYTMITKSKTTHA